MDDALIGNNILLGAALATRTIPLEKKLIEETLTEQVKQAQRNIDALNIGYNKGKDLLNKNQ